MDATPGAEERHAGRQLQELRVLLVDDHDLFRTGLRTLLEQEGLQVIGEAENGQVALRLVGELAPDVVIMDLNMPGLTGVETTHRCTFMGLHGIETVGQLARVKSVIVEAVPRAGAAVLNVADVVASRWYFQLPFA
jgi:DNA-binding NarL/FixJ family response regulator